MIKQCFCDWNINRNLILTGLHTCGSLTHSAIKTFLVTEDIRILCIVPCCYHLTNETFSRRISFSKNARMLAQQCIERSTKNKIMPSSLFYRAILQVILHSMGTLFCLINLISLFVIVYTIFFSLFLLIGIYDARVGRGGPLNDFTSYARWAFSRIGVKPEKV